MSDIVRTEMCLYSAISDFAGVGINVERSPNEISLGFLPRGRAGSGADADWFALSISDARLLQRALAIALREAK